MRGDTIEGSGTSDSFGLAGYEVKVFDDSRDILDNPTNSRDNFDVGPLDDVIGVFGELGDTLDVLLNDRVEVNPIHAIADEFNQIEGHLNLFNGDREFLTEPFREPIDTITSLDAFNSLRGTTAESFEIVDGIGELADSEGSSEMFGGMMTEENLEDVESMSPFAQFARFLGYLWESLGGLSEEKESLHPHAMNLNDTEVYFIIFLSFCLLFMLVLGLLLCFYCKKKMWERERWMEILQSDVDSDSSGSWISIDSSTQVSPIMYTPTKEKEADKFENVFWFRSDLEISPSILV